MQDNHSASLGSDNLTRTISMSSVTTLTLFTQLGEIDCSLKNMQAPPPRPSFMSDLMTKYHGTAIEEFGMLRFSQVSVMRIPSGLCCWTVIKKNRYISQVVNQC